MSRGTIRAVMLTAAVSAAHTVAGGEPVDKKTGLVIDKGFDIVQTWCTACHSARLITQAGKTRDGWRDTIRWMQATQGLRDLGEREDEILDYLSKNYGVPPAAAPLRPPVAPLSR
jgi:cytochrome c5